MARKRVPARAKRTGRKNKAAPQPKKAFEITTVNGMVPPGFDQGRPLIAALDVQSRGKFRIALASPLVIGSFAVAGFPPQSFNPWLLIPLVALFGVVRLYLDSERKQRKLPRWLAVITAVTAVASITIFALLSTDLFATVLAVAVVLLFLALERCIVTSLRSLLEFVGALLLFSALLAVVAVYCQVPLGVQFRAAWLGIPTGAMIAAAVVSALASLLERNGWKRRIERKKRDGSPVMRPGGITMVFVFLLMVTPSLLLLLTPLGYFPPAFMLLAFPVFLTPPVCTAFFEGLASDQEVALRTTKIAAITAAAMFIVVILLNF